MENRLSSLGQLSLDIGVLNEPITSDCLPVDPIVKYLLVMASHPPHVREVVLPESMVAACLEFQIHFKINLIAK